MSVRNGQGRVYRRVVYTVCICVLLLAVFFAAIHRLYKDAESEGLNDLRMRADQIKDEISLQLISDHENLTTLSRLAGALREEGVTGSSWQVLLDSFESIGLIDHIALLTPDDVLHTYAGKIDVSDRMSFEEEVGKGEYISGRMQDVTNPQLQIIRCSIPVVSEGKTVAILFGAIALEDLNERYSGYINDADTELFLLNSDTGNFIIDTMHENLGSIYDLEEYESKKGFSYQRMLDDMKAGRWGYTSFQSPIADQYLYIYYAPMGIENWQIMLAQTEDTLFDEANSIGSMMAFLFTTMIVLVSVYIIIIFEEEQRRSSIYRNASRIRKLLLEINQNRDSVIAALKNVVSCTNSGSAFYVDSDGEAFSYTHPACRNKMVAEAENEYFRSWLKAYAAKSRRDLSLATIILNIAADASLRDADPGFYQFMKEHRFRNITFSCVENMRDDNVILLGIVNPRRFYEAKALLREMSVCFSMAIYNMKYLNRTELVAVTDSLTGLSNRLAYKRMISVLGERIAEQFSCVYVDVNELHFINNKYGHSAGDEMLLYVAKSIQKVFPQGCIYRVGGDEFLVFNEGLSREAVVRGVSDLQEMVEVRNYHISVGMDFRSRNTDTEAVVKAAEKRMYEAKAEYYQNAGSGVKNDGENTAEGRCYTGIYCVSFDRDSAYSILKVGCLERFTERTDSFSKALFDYMHEYVEPDRRRNMLNALRYDVLKMQLSEGRVPSVSYIKKNGERAVITVHAVPDQKEIEESIWTFERYISE